MKIFICILVLACTCNAEILNNNNNHITYNAALAAGGGGDHGHGNDNINYANNHDVSYTHGYSYSDNHVQDYGGPSQAILDHSSASRGTSGIQSYEGSYASGPNYGYGAPIGGEQQIFKVIAKSAPSPVSAPAPTAFSHASNFHDVNSQLNSILPQILHIILQTGSVDGSKSSSSENNSYLNSLLIPHYGLKGEAVITRSHKNSADNYFSSGHVIEKGVLKVKSVKREPSVAHSGPIHGHTSRRSLVYGW